MAQLKLTKKGLVVLISILFLFGIGIEGFLYWRVTSNDTVAPTDSSAGGGGGGSGRCNCSKPRKDDSRCGSGGNGRVYYYCDPNPSACSTELCPRNEGEDPTIRCHCPDGSWKIGKAKSCDDLCADRQGNSGQECWCDSWNNCGSNCRFPAGTAGRVAQKAQQSCGMFIAMCQRHPNDSTTVSIEPFGPGHVCWGKEQECNNPVAGAPCANTCDGGAIQTPTASANYNVGDVVTVSGYAFDTDGINKTKIVVKVNGVVVGNATATDLTCTTGSTVPACVAAAGKKVVTWTYNYTVTQTGAVTFDVSWEDINGLTGASCQGSRAITGNIQGNPDWQISKTGSTVCIDNTAGSMKARVDYSIVVKNIGNLAGQLTKLVDTMDSKVQTSYVQTSTVSPTASLSSNILTWTLTGDAGQFDPNEQKEFKYSIVVPQSAFGQYTNTAEAFPDSGDTFKAIEVAYASCDAPQTGIFDSTASKVILGFVLISISAAYLYSEKGSFSVKRRSAKEKFEDRVAGK